MSETNGRTHERTEAIALPSTLMRSVTSGPIKFDIYVQTFNDGSTLAVAFVYREEGFGLVRLESLGSHSLVYQLHKCAKQGKQGFVAKHCQYSLREL